VRDSPSTSACRNHPEGQPPGEGEAEADAPALSDADWVLVAVLVLLMVGEGVDDVEGVRDREEEPLTLVVGDCVPLTDIVEEAVTVTEPVGMGDTGMHAVAPVLGVYVPAPQAMQAVALVYGAYCPTLPCHKYSW
jgi:hypothetical protein